MKWQVLDAKPVDVFDELDAERRELLGLLEALPPESWLAPTECPGWRVREVVAHVLHDDFRLIAHLRDGFEGVWFDGPLSELGAYLHERNGAFVDGTRDLSPELLIELLRTTGEELAAVYRARDPSALDDGVAWAIPDGPSPNWLGSGREYTERLAHQNQIRRALGAEELVTSRWLGPALDIWRWCLPVALSNAAGTVSVEATGAIVRLWTLVDGRFADHVVSPDAYVTADAAVLARLWTDAPAVDFDAQTGDERLIDAVRAARAIIV